MSSSIGGAASSFGGVVKPPDKGAFPLDHFNECKEVMERYLECMKVHRSSHAQCRELTVKYLQCRMDK